MSADQVVQQVFSNIDAQKFDVVLSLLSDNYTFSGATPTPINGQAWVAVHRALAAAMPDLRMNYRTTSVNGNQVQGTVELQGTHTGELALPIPGLPRVAPTGKAIKLPLEHIQVQTTNGKVAAIEVEDLPNGGVKGILMQMGVALPHQ